MPTLNRTAFATVTGLWGTALIRGADGKMRVLKMGDVVQQGDVILTSQDGIVQLTNEQGERRVAHAAAPNEIDRVIQALNRDDAEAAPAAGLTAGDGGDLTPGLRVDRIAEGITAAAFGPGTSGVERIVTPPLTGDPADGQFRLVAASSSISAVEEGAPVGLGLAEPGGIASAAAVTVDEVPAIGQIVRADGSVVTAGSVLTPADLAGLRYVPPADYDGTAPVGRFAYTLDSNGSTVSGETTIALTAVNDAPVAAPGAARGAEDAALPVAIGLAGSDVDGTIAGVTVTTLPAGGTLLLADGVTPVAVGQVLTPAQAASLLYRPAADYNGATAITHTVTDDAGAVSAPAQFRITITPVDDAPVAAPDSGTTPEDTALTGNVLANDSDVDSAVLGVTQFTVNGTNYLAGTTATLAGIGTLSIAGNGAYAFTPAANYNGTLPPVSYVVSEGTTSVTSTLTLTVTPVADAPIAADDLASTPINTALASIAVLANDSDADGNALTVASAALVDPTLGSVSVNADGTLNFTPALNVSGPVAITYTVADGTGLTDTATLVANVGANTPPTGADAAPTTPEDTPYTVAGADGGFADADAGQSLANVRIDALPAAGVLSLGGTAVAAGAVITAADIAAGRLVFTPAPDANGSPYAGFSFSVQDSAGAWDAAPNAFTIAVTPVNDLPQAGNDTASTDEDTPLTLSPAALLANDSDVDGDPLTLISVQDAVNGSVALVGGNVVFTPAADYNGPASFTYTVSDGQGGTRTASVAVDVRPVVDPVISIGDVAVDEAAGTATFTVTLNQATTATVSVQYGTGDGTAVAGSDYTGSSGTLTFAPGIVSQTITVPIADDAVYEGNEDFTVTLSAPVNATIGDGSAVGTITDNDIPALAVSSPVVAEGGGFAVFTISLSNASTQATTVSLATTAGTATAGADYSAALEVSSDGGATWATASSATIAAGATSVLVRSAITADTIDELDESFSLTATRTAGTTSNASATGSATITDDDATPTLAIGDVTVNEAAGTATFTVTLSAASGLPVTVGFATADGTATAGSDYTAAAGTLSFAPGVTSQTITVPIVNDAVYEGSEAFTVTLSAPTNASIADISAIGTIVDDGTGPGGTDNDAPFVTSATSPTVVEGGNLDFTITLSNASTTPTVVSLGTPTGSATYGTDTAQAQVSYDGGTTFATIVGWSVAVPAGVTSFIVRVPTVDDALGEPAETLIGSAATAANAAPVAATGTILDNDTPVVSISGAITYYEAAGTASYTVTLSNAATTPVSVNYATVSGTASAGADFVASLGTLNFAPGVTSQTVTVAILDDAVYEGAETFAVTLSAPAGATLGAATSTTTIVDDGSGVGGTDSDVPEVVAVGSPTAAEGGNLDFTVTLGNASTTPTTVTLTLASGSATLGADTGGALVSFDGGASFVAVGGPSISVPAGVTSLIVRVPAVDDATGEPMESFTLSASTAANPVPLTGTGTITDNDLPALTVSSPTVAENGAYAVFTVALSNASSTATTVGFALANGTATGGGTDYGAAGATNLQVSTNGGVSWTNAASATIAAGSTSVLVRTPITNDTIDEPAENFTLTATRTGGSTSNSAATGTATITDNDPAPTITIANVSVAENVASGYAQFTVRLSNPSSTATTLGLALADGSATGGGVDYGSGGATNLQISTNGGATWVSASSVTIAAGATSVLVRTPIVNDALDEANETFTLTATRTAGTTANATASGTATITDNDATPSLRINDVTVDEAAGTASFTVTLSAASGRAVGVSFATTNGSATAGSDYTARTGSLSFAPGVTSQTITVPITDDASYEGAETFRVVLSGATNASIADNSGTATITANDVPTLAVSAPTVVEDAGFAVFTVSLSNPSSVATTVGLALTNATATGSGVDYGAGGAANLQVSTNGGGTWTNATTATFAAGATSVLVRTPVTNDTLAEGTETFTLTATHTAGTTANASASGLASIVDNDAAPALIVGDVTVDEAAGTATFTVTLSVASGLPVSASFATSNGTAIAGADYTAVTGTVNFAPGVTIQTITVPITDDAVYEGNEDFTVTLSAPVNATIGDGSAVGTITDNDIPALAVSSPVVAEGGGFAVFTISLSNASTQATTVSLATTAGTATAGADYSAALEVSSDGGATWATASSATIAAGATSVLVRSAITADTIDELDESFSLTATRTAGTTSNAAATGSATITDDDATPTLSIGDVTVNEAAGTATFTVTLSAASGLPVTVAFASADGTASAASDYSAVAGSLTFTPGVTSQTITVPIANDALYEGSEAFAVTLSAPANATLADATAVGTITDNDAPPVLDLDADDSSGAAGANYATAYTENSAAVQIVDTDVIVSDADSPTLMGATVTLTNAQAGDVLAAGAMPAGITATVAGNTVTLAGAASAAAYQTALRAITFANGSDTPSTTPRTITISVTDGAQTSNVATTTVAVTAVNDAPTAVADAASTAEDTPLAIPRSTLTANDTDPEGNALAITSVQGAVNGSVALVGGNVVFTPNGHYSGPASFTYTVSDGNGGTSTATVNVVVAAVVDAPALIAPSQINSLVQGSNTISTEPGITQANLEATLNLTSGVLDTFAPPSGPGTNDAGNVNVIDGKASNYALSLEAGNVASFNWQFLNGENVTSEINNGFNDLVVLVITKPDGTKQHVQLSSSEQTGINTNGAAADATGTYNYTATTDGAYQFSWLVLNGGDDGKDSSLTVAAPTVRVGGTSYGQPVSLPIVNGLVDRDGSETLSAVTISGMPTGAALSAGTDLGGGTWSVSAAQLAELKILPPDSYTGAFNLTVSSTATEASNGSSTTTTQTVAVTVSATTSSLLGTQNGDTLSGTSANETLQGFGGNDTINAGGGNDLVYGGNGNDTIDGGTGNDLLHGDAGNDTLVGGAGNDVLYGGVGSDTLTGGADADTFAWTLSDRGTPGSAPIDTITDFANGAGGDRLDLRDLLNGENSGNLADYLHFTTAGSTPTSTTTISISSTGGFAAGYVPGAVDQVIQISGVNLVGGMSSDTQVIADLISRGKLVVDNG